MAAFYMDHNVAQGTALLLQGSAHLATTARQVGLDAASDDEHLLKAADEGWVLISYNIKDFVLLHRAWLRWSKAWGVNPAHSGILLIPSPPRLLPEQAARELDTLVGRLLLLRNELYSLRSDGVWYRWDPASGWLRPS